MSSPQNVEGSGRGELELSLRTRHYIGWVFLSRARRCPGVGAGVGPFDRLILFFMKNIFTKLPLQYNFCTKLPHPRIPFICRPPNSGTTYSPILGGGSTRSHTTTHDSRFASMTVATDLPGVSSMPAGAAAGTSAGVDREGIYGADRGKRHQQSRAVCCQSADIIFLLRPASLLACLRVGGGQVAGRFSSRNFDCGQCLLEVCW